MTDNGSEFRARQFGRTVSAPGARQKFIHAGKPKTNGCVERVRGTILEECRKPSFARYLVPKQTGLKEGAEPLPSLLQPGPDPCRPLEPQPDPRGGHRRGQNLLVSSSGMCRYISATGQARRRTWIKKIYRAWRRAHHIRQAVEDPAKGGALRREQKPKRALLGP